MARTNRQNRPPLRTHEGGIAQRIGHEQQLLRSVCACLLWESTFYEDELEVATRIADEVREVSPEFAAALAVKARTKLKLRHAPLWIVRSMAALESHKHLVASTLAEVVQRPDELTEFLSLYWMGQKTPLSAQVKKGLARAFTKFTEYQLAKYVQYNVHEAITLRDVMFLCHPKPLDEDQADMWRRLANKERLAVPDTWEVALSTGKDKRETWERLIGENKLGGLAMLRNLRNMQEVGVPEALIEQGLRQMRTDRILPFRFITAARYASTLEPVIEEQMLACLRAQRPMPGTTALLIDVSGSMEDRLSAKSELTRMDAAAALAILCREKCERVNIYTFSVDLVAVPPRHGFALADAIMVSQDHGGTYLAGAIRGITEPYDRLIVFTDSQSHDGVANPKQGIKSIGMSSAYLIDVSTNRNGIGYGEHWTHINGFSEATIEYVMEIEGLNGGLEQDGLAEQD